MEVKKKIALVNVLFPPNALGGATRIVTDEIAGLKELYGDEFEVVVFTADFDRRPLYNVNVYPYQGFRVYSVSCELTIESNWLEQDENIARVFDEFLAFENPDLVHFHAVQVLTGSVVEVTQKTGIPYLVTIHDAWWISDHQFLVDRSNLVYPNGHPDPFESVSLPDGVSLERSITRKSYLKRLLAGSEHVLAVSDTYRTIYESNGVGNVITNKNGISRSIPWKQKDTRHTEKVVCAHIGGISDHKGFGIFQRAVSSTNVPNIEVVVVDHSMEEGRVEQARWGTTGVTVMGHVSQENIANLYERIDVLFAPSIAPESYGLVTREAAACGCWLVASNVGAIGEDITRDNGFRVSPTEFEIAKILKEIDRNIKRYKSPSYSTTIRFSEEQVRELVELIREVINNKETR